MKSSSIRIDGFVEAHAVSQRTSAEANLQTAENTLKGLIPEQYRQGLDLIKAADTLSRCELNEIQAVYTKAP